jgi:hypothetical protein
MEVIDGKVRRKKKNPKTFCSSFEGEGRACVRAPTLAMSQGRTRSLSVGGSRFFLIVPPRWCAMEICKGRVDYDVTVTYVLSCAIIIF